MEENALELIRTSSGDEKLEVIRQTLEKNI